MLLSLCDKSYMMEVFFILKLCLKIICILTPIIVIINTTIRMTKAVQTGKDEDIKNCAKQGVKNIIAGLIVFMLPTLFSYVFTNLVDGEGDSLLACLETASIEKVNSLKEKEKAERLAEKKAEDTAIKGETDKRTEAEKAKNDATPKPDKSQNNNNNNDNSGSSGNTNNGDNGSSGSGNVSINTNGVNGSDYANKLANMQTPTMAQLESAASSNGISKDYLIVIIGTTEREGYINDPYLYYGWASAMINNRTPLSQMQGWDPYHSGDANYYSQANINKGYNNASANTLKSVYLALTERNTKIVECNGMYNSTPSSYNLLYKSSVYNCSIYEKK